MADINNHSSDYRMEHLSLSAILTHYISPEKSMRIMCKIKLQSTNYTENIIVHYMNFAVLE